MTDTYRVETSHNAHVWLPLSVVPLSILIVCRIRLRPDASCVRPNEGAYSFQRSSEPVEDQGLGEGHDGGPGAVLCVSWVMARSTGQKIIRAAIEEDVR